MKKYCKNMDIAKGIGIMLVVLGHSMPKIIREDNTYLSFLFTFIYSFHMPLFFFISGFFSISIYNIDKLKKYIKYIKKKYNRLIIPYVSISLIGMPFAIYMSKHNYLDFSDINSLSSVKTILYNMVFFPASQNQPVSPMWYIYTLFLLFILVCILNKIKMKYMLIISFFLMILATKSFVKDINLLNINLVFKFSFYFYLGMCFNKYYEKYNNFKFKNIITLISFIILIISNIKSDFIPFGRSFVGIIFCITLSSIIQENVLGRIFLFLGKFSYDIYLFSWFFQVAFIRLVFLYILNINQYILIVLMFLGGFLPILLSKLILRKTYILSKLLLGNSRM